MTQRKVFVAAVALLVVVVIGSFVYQRTGPVPVRPADIETLDPLLRERIEQRLTFVAGRRRSADAWRQLGMLYEANALYGDAALCYEDMLSRWPNDGRTLHRLACVQERSGDLARARSTMERAALTQPDYAASWGRLALWSLDLGELDAAVEALAKARALAPGDTTMHFIAVRLELARRSPETALAQLEEHGLLKGKQAPYGHHLLSIARRQAGDPEGAAAAHAQSDGSRLPFFDAWSQEMQRYQTGYAAMRLSAGRYVKAGRYSAARKLLEQVIAYDQEDVRSLNMLAVCLMNEGDPAAAIACLERLFAIEPQHHDGVMNYVRAVLRQGKAGPEILQSVHERLRRALDLRPDEHLGWRLLASLAEARGKLDEAIEALERAMALDPDATDIRLKAGYLAMKRGAFADALSRFLALQASHPELSDAWFGEVKTFVLAGRANEARAAYEVLAKRAGLDRARLMKIENAVAAMKQD